MYDKTTESKNFKAAASALLYQYGLKVKRPSGTPDYHYLHDPQSFKKHAPDIYDHIEMIRELSPTGRELLKWAEKNNVCFTTDLNESSTMGVFEMVDGRPSLRLNPAFADKLPSIAMHELFHAVQFIEYEAGALFGQQDFFNRARSVLVCEAAAETFSILVGYEMKLAGHADVFASHMASMQGKQLRYDLLARGFDRIYSEHIENGYTHKIALQDAFDCIFHAYLGGKGFVDSYGQRQLGHYLARISEYDFRQAAFNIREQAVPISDMVRMPSGKSVLKEFDLPETLPDLLRHNQDFIHAAKWAEYQRLLHAEGYPGARADKDSMRFLLIEEGNPFMRLGLHDTVQAIAEDLQKPGELRQGAVHVMLRLAGHPGMENIPRHFATGARKEKSPRQKPYSASVPPTSRKPV